MAGASVAGAGPEAAGKDVRLVPPALAAWGAAALALVLPGQAVAVGTTVLVALAVVGLTLVRRGRGRAVSQDSSAGATRARRGPAAASGTAGTAASRRGRRRGPGWSAVTTVSAVLLCAAAGAASAGLHGADVRRGPVPALARAHATVDVEVTVTSDPRQARTRVHGSRSAPVLLLFDAEVTRLTSADGSITRLRTPVLLMVSPGTATDRWTGLLPTTGLRLTGRLAPAAQPGERSAALLRVEREAPPRVVRGPTGIQRVAGDLREGLRRATEGLDGDARALLPGLVVGDTARVPTDLHDAFEATDLTHLLSVSGANLSILLFLLIGPPGRATRAERGGLAPRLGISLRMTALLGGAITLAFVVVCRPEPSVLRAAACGLITLLAIGSGRRRSLIPALATAVLLLVLYDPWLARSYGFLLSVLATGALLTLAPRWSEGLRRRSVPGRLAEVLAAAAAAQAVCAPVVVVLASRVSLVGIPCNLLAEFAVAPATVLGFAALAFAPVSPPTAELLARIAAWPVDWIAAVARTGAGLPGAQIGWPGGWSGAMLLALLTVVVVCCARLIARRPWMCVAASLALVLAVLRPAPLTRVMTGWPPPDWAFAACDVGQGDALVLAAGEGAGVVVDAGPEPDAVDGCLRDLGISRVPMVLLTHFHADHVRGLSGVLRGRSVGAIQTTGLHEPHDQAAFVHRTAAEAGVPVGSAVPGERRRAGAVEWQVLWAGERTGGAARGGVRGPPADTGANDSSVTLFVRARGALTLLLMGDLEPPAQRGLARDHPGLPPVDVLKVAHHGSAFQDPALLAQVRPRVAVISCGADNTYGHPAPRTVAALTAGGAEVFRTDRDGAVAVAGAGASLRVAGRD
ncbi:ComEC/Rec2 family competence protein [uncultured Streptomyces sp.]|uniref:ComEC/Rec2 family competence protein n=1 Tax=uncultured Streptomyces sp. TaxID=174707 RepID=UPI0026119619|nr:ComEC/Rec2 family competence protein [uncultured Streptomyces sp.]